MQPGKTYLVKGGMLNMHCQSRKLLTWDEGDLILPDAAPDAPDTMEYSSENAVLLAGYDTLELVRAALSSDDTARLWTRLLMTQQGIMLRLLAAQVDEETQTTPGFAYYMPGDIIIRQGDPADYVFSLFEGSADVMVDDVVVGEVNEGEVLGALAVLTHAPRMAYVRHRMQVAGARQNPLLRGQGTEGPVQAPDSHQPDHDPWPADRHGQPDQEIEHPCGRAVGVIPACAPGQ